MGDFNGHLRENNQDKRVTSDKNGKRVHKIPLENKITILNHLDVCNGKFTWMRGKSKSIIDYMLVSEEKVKDVVDMSIDDTGERWEYWIRP